MVQLQNTVFICYRRSTSSFIARAIYLDLRQHGYDVFMDIENINSGNFEKIILSQIAARSHFLIICTAGTFERTIERKDWLRREISEAIKLKRNIVPILVNDFRFDEHTEALLPKGLRRLSRYNGVHLTHDYFDAAMERLRTRFLTSLVDGPWVNIPLTELRLVEEKQTAIELQPKPTLSDLAAEELFTRGNQSREKKDYDDAILQYEKAVKLNPRYAQAYNNLGISYAHIGELTRALQSYDKVLALDHQHFNALFNRGNLLERMKEYARALEDFRLAYELTDDETLRMVIGTRIEDIHRRLNR